MRRYAAPEYPFRRLAKLTKYRLPSTLLSCNPTFPSWLLQLHLVWGPTSCFRSIRSSLLFPTASGPLSSLSTGSARRSIWLSDGVFATCPNYRTRGPSLYMRRRLRILLLERWSSFSRLGNASAANSYRSHSPWGLAVSSRHCMRLFL